MHLAHGTIVFVSKVSPLLLNYTVVNVIVFPASSDFDNVDGLCGTFDGDQDNDLTYRYGDTVTVVETDDKGWQIGDDTDFVQSYE